MKTVLCIFFGAIALFFGYYSMKFLREYRRDRYSISPGFETFEAIGKIVVPLVFAVIFFVVSIIVGTI